jgi:signal transduction histidine kinase
VRVERGEGSVVVTVADDGRGFADGRHSTLGGGLGLVGMQERAAGVGARVQVESAEGRGTRDVMTLPIDRARQDPSESEV